MRPLLKFCLPHYYIVILRGSLVLKTTEAISYFNSYNFMLRLVIQIPRLPALPARQASLHCVTLAMTILYMPKIKLLSSFIISKIAAGEVIERPFSVVKELIENSLDAGATNIKIEIEKGGLKKISILDDGCGMEKDDLEICHEPHTTSKINFEEELNNILSLGFRGEALSSIAAVSEIIIRSKTKNNTAGNYIKIINREIAEKNPIGMPTGTQIIVENIFENTPARKKFFTSESQEFQHILNLVTKIALSAPAVGFNLSHNGKSILNISKNQTIAERIYNLFGNKISNFLIPLSFQSPYLNLEGFIGKPQIATGSKNKQYLFVNGRLIRNLPISLAIKDSYGNLLDPKSHPIFFLSVSIAPENIDVNIHPRKEEIKFLSTKDVTGNIKEAIKETLEKHNLTYRYDLGSHEEKNNYTASILREQTPIWNVKEEITDKEILQIHNTYLIVETNRGALLIDQHAAHERILYEQFLETFQQLRNISSGLSASASKQPERTVRSESIYTFPEAIVFSLPITEANYLTNHLDTFLSLGFDIEPFGDDTFKLNAVPDIFKERNVFSLISEVLDDLMQEKSSLPIDRYTEKTISYLSCRSAIKAGDHLTPDERKKLLDKLQEIKSNYTCPHGRPVQVEISKNELEKMFRRR